LTNRTHGTSWNIQRGVYLPFSGRLDPVSSNLRLSSGWPRGPGLSPARDTSERWPPCSTGNLWEREPLLHRPGLVLGLPSARWVFVGHVQ